MEFLSRPPKRKRRGVRQVPKPIAPAVEPWHCVLLAVDPGEESGWAIYGDGKLFRYGTTNCFAHGKVRNIVAAAQQIAELGSVPCVLLLERPYSARVLGPSRALWKDAWLKAGESKDRIVRAYPSHWRKELFGKGTDDTETARRREQLLAQLVAETSQPIEHNAAAAISQGRWGSRSYEVWRVLPEEIRHRSEASL
jgi:hypothetical protein